MSQDEGTAYICRKNFQVIIVQAVCDHTMKFTHCYTGEVGSVHDAKVLRNSELWSYMTTGAEEKFPNNMHLLGDKAYPLSQTLLIPYKTYGQLNSQQRNLIIN
ncbi:uncharacterized protein LOC107268626 [Cephus cinctus]|uniref:Uncharacterized protein LOC107268626 n=1 Tax=Cephus cinctus TaxID=211228 RepID=A0AAJ7RJ26_CEPCN|nr:uncharacterized protein LOC107268626 [Cephus cinctus]